MAVDREERSWHSNRKQPSAKPNNYPPPNFFKIFIYLFTWLCWVLVVACGIFTVACGIFSCIMRTLSCGTWDLVPWPGMEPGALVLGAQSLSHWTTREVPPPPNINTAEFEKTCYRQMSHWHSRREVQSGNDECQDWELGLLCTVRKSRILLVKKWWILLGNERQSLWI